VVRSAIHVGMSHASFDERGFELVRRIRAMSDGADRLPLPAFKALIREQYFMLVLDEEAALAAIPSLLPARAEERRKGLAIVRQLAGARGDLTGKAAKRLDRVIALFNTKEKEHEPQVTRIPA